jgi:exosortase A
MFMTTAPSKAADFWKYGVTAAAVLTPFLLYFATARSIVDIWNSSETFAHGYVILPITIWLLWTRRHTLPLDAARPYWPALLLLAICGFGWLLADLATVQVVKQYAFVAMIPLIALTVLGVRLSGAMAFPLLFLLLAVPFGEFLIAPLIEFTADFTVAALQASGIPVLRNGPHFDIPTGSWSVVEACSGVRYLISSFTLGCLYAYLTYRSHLRRAVFVLLSIVVPIVANGMRAYLIVMLGHLSGMQLAVGVDHLIYGWLFFGVVMFLMFWIGRLWREDVTDSELPARTMLPADTAKKASTSQIVAAAAASVACVSIWPVYASYIERAARNPMPARLENLEARWQESSPFTQWKPRFTLPCAELHKYFQRNAEQVGLSILYYRHSCGNAQLISSVNRIVGEKDKTYRQVGASLRQENIGGRMLGIREASIDSSAGSMLVWHWYWINGTVTVSDYAGKFLQAKEQFLMRGNDSAAVMVFAPYSARPDEARTAMRDYLTANLAPIEATLAGNMKAAR